MLFIWAMFSCNLTLLPLWLFYCCYPSQLLLQQLTVHRPHTLVFPLNTARFPCMANVHCPVCVCSHHVFHALLAHVSHSCAVLCIVLLYLLRVAPRPEDMILHDILRNDNKTPLTWNVRYNDCRTNKQKTKKQNLPTLRLQFIRHVATGQNKTNRTRSALLKRTRYSVQNITFIFEQHSRLFLGKVTFFWQVS